MHTRTTVVVTEVDKGWQLRLTTYQEGSKPVAKLIIRNTLMEVLEIANVLRLHIDNNNVLPLKQYKQGA